MARLISAALVDRTFCNLLLFDPCTALARGFRGETFALTEAEEHFVLTVRADSLVALAFQWVASNDRPSTLGDAKVPVFVNYPVSLRKE